jgi:hypothetical protein
VIEASGIGSARARIVGRLAPRREATPIEARRAERRPTDRIRSTPALVPHYLIYLLP